MASRWACQAAARIGRRAGFLAAAGFPRPNPFDGKPGLTDLAEAWQHGYDRAVHPSSGGGR